MTNDLLTYPDREALQSEPRFGAFAGKKALVTGGLGFIGSNLVHALHALGAGVIVVDSLAEGQGGNRFNLRGIDQQVDVRIADLRDEASTGEAVAGVDYVFNMAGTGNHLDSMESPLRDLETNVRGTLVLLEAVRHRAPQAHVVHAGSRSEYGSIQTSPVNESHPLLPTEINSANKAAATLYNYVYFVAHGLHTVTLRLTNTYGPRMLAAHHRQGFINWFVRLAVEGGRFRLYGDGSQLRDMVYVDDLIQAMLLAAVTPIAAGKILNHGSGSPASLREIATHLCEINPQCSIEYTPFPEAERRIEIGDYVADTTAICHTLGWHPAVGLREGLERSVRYYRAYREHYW
jgi:UDP-glucose 4-epimerase